MTPDNLVVSFSSSPNGGETLFIGIGAEPQTRPVFHRATNSLLAEDGGLNPEASYALEMTAWRDASSGRPGQTLSTLDQGITEHLATDSSLTVNQKNILKEIQSTSSRIRNRDPFAA